MIDTVLSNLAAMHNADVSYRRQNAMMNKQNEMNMANLRGTPMAQVEGLRMAGFNPAMVAGSGTASAPSTSLGSADMAQTFPLDIGSTAQLALLDAQRENIEADTAVKRANVPNIEKDTSLKGAEILFKNAGVDKIREESRNIKNINDAYDAQNKGFADFGKVIAERWQSSDWFKSLAPDTKATIDAIAYGEVELSVGMMKAISDSIRMQKDLSDADRSLVNNALLNAVSEAQFNDKAVMDALAKLPKAQYDLAVKHKDELDAVISKIGAEIPKIVNESKNLEQARKMMKSQLKSFESSDLGFLKAKGYETGDFTSWLEQFAENQLENVFDLGKAYVAGRGLRAGSTPATPKSEPPTVIKPGDSEFRSTLENLNKGVGNFRF